MSSSGPAFCSLRPAFSISVHADAAHPHSDIKLAPPLPGAPASALRPFVAPRVRPAQEREG